MLAALGVAHDFLPPLVAAGEDLGAATVGVPPAFAGARLTVAGHDHLVAAEADGPSRPTTTTCRWERPRCCCGSSMRRSVSRRGAGSPLPDQRRASRRAGQARARRGREDRAPAASRPAGVRHPRPRGPRPARRGRHAAALRGDLPSGGLEVSGARNDDGVLGITVRTDGVSPAEVFGAVLRHSNDEIRQLIAAMDRELPPARSATLTGGWVGMASVRRARAEVLPHLSVSNSAAGDRVRRGPRGRTPAAPAGHRRCSPDRRCPHCRCHRPRLTRSTTPFRRTT